MHRKWAARRQRTDEKIRSKVTKNRNANKFVTSSCECFGETIKTIERACLLKTTPWTHRQPTHTTDWWRLMRWTKQIPSSLICTPHPLRTHLVAAWHTSHERMDACFVPTFSESFAGKEKGQELPYTRWIFNNTLRVDGFTLVFAPDSRRQRFSLSAKTNVCTACRSNYRKKECENGRGEEMEETEETEEVFRKQIDSVK